MDYDDAIAAVMDGGGDVYAARTSWPYLPPTATYLGLVGSDLLKYTEEYPAGQPYSPTADDESATDWIKGGDHPPSQE